MKFWVLCALLVSLACGLGAYQYHAFGLYTPSVLEGWQGEFNVGHRFYGEILEEPIDNFFGMGAGTNANLSFRQHLPLDLEAKLGHTSSLNQYELGAAWKIPFEMFTLKSQADINLSWLDRPASNERTTDIGAWISAQNEPLFGRLVITANLGYNTLYERLGCGLGINVSLLDRLSLLGEFYPLLDPEKGSPEALALMGEYPAFAAGIKLDTHNHNFLLSVGNAQHFNPARLALGAYSRSDLHFGFNIKRRLSF